MNTNQRLIDPNITPDLMNELVESKMYDELQKLVNDTINCDEECQRSSYQEYLYQQYLKAQNNFRDGKKNLNQAEKLWFTERDGEKAYFRLKRAEAKKSTEDAIIVWQRKFQDLTNLIQTLSNSLEQVKGRTDDKKEIIDTTEKKIKKTEYDIKKQINKIDLNERLVEIHNDNKNTYNRFYGYLKIAFWILFSISIIAIILTQQYKYLRFWDKSIPIVKRIGIFYPIYFMIIYFIIKSVSSGEFKYIY